MNAPRVLAVVWMVTVSLFLAASRAEVSHSGPTPHFAVINPARFTPSDDPDSNDTPGTATVIVVPHQGDYAIDPAGDIDWYRMELAENTLLHIYSERIDGSQLDPEARFYGPHSADGSDLDPTDWIYVDDDGHGDMQPDIRIVIPSSGFYFLRMAHYQNDPTRADEDSKEQQRADTGLYRLFVQVLPDQPEIWIDPQNLDFGLSPGDSASAFFSVYNSGNIPLHVSSITVDQPWLNLSEDSLVVPPDSVVDMTATANATGLAPGTYLATITVINDDPNQSSLAIPVVLTVAMPDSNNTPADATPILLPHTGNYAIAPTGDVDWYRVHIDAGTAWMIYTERLGGSQIDPEAWFYGPHAADGADVVPSAWIANDDDSHGALQPELNVSITETGYYFLRIAHFLNNPAAWTPEHKNADRAATGEYRLIIEPGTASEPAAEPASLFLSVSPNPATDRISVAVSLPEQGWVALGMYDLSGRLILDLMGEMAGPGMRVVNRDVRPLQNGTYVCRLAAGTHRESRTILIHR